MPGGSLVNAVFDRTAALAGVLFLSPFLLLAALAIALDDGFPILFRQNRIGRNGRPFQILKFRSMRIGLPGTRITATGDRRHTRVGRFLRKYKLDELPQLWNVLRGEMSLIGPRPEVAAFVDTADPVWQAVLRVRPGITDLASLVYRNEEDILARLPDPERHYREVVLPAKLALNLRYLRRRSLRLDLKLLLWTLRSCLSPAAFDPDQVQRSFGC